MTITLFPCAAAYKTRKIRAYTGTTINTVCLNNSKRCCSGTGLGSGAVIVGFRVQKTKLRVPSSWGPTVRFATTTALPAYGAGSTLTATANGAFPGSTILAATDRVRVNGETGANAVYNGFWIISVLGDANTPWKLERSSDLSSPVSFTTTAALPAYTAAGSTLTATANGIFPDTDDVTPKLTDRLLVKDETGTSRAFQGIWRITVLGDANTPWKLERPPDMNSATELTRLGSSGTNKVFVSAGTANASTAWKGSYSTVTTLNTTVLPFTSSSLGTCQAASTTACNLCHVAIATTTALPGYDAAGSPTTLTAQASGTFPDTDGVTPAANDRILVKDESGAQAKYNGVYTFGSIGGATTKWTLTRATDMNSSRDIIQGMMVSVTSGTVNGATACDCVWELTTAGPYTLDTTALAFSSSATAHGIKLRKKRLQVPIGSIVSVVSTTCTTNPICCLPSCDSLGCSAMPRYWLLNGSDVLMAVGTGPADVFPTSCFTEATLYNPHTSQCRWASATYFTGADPIATLLIFTNGSGVVVSLTLDGITSHTIPIANFNCYGSNTFPNGTIEPYEP